MGQLPPRLSHAVGFLRSSSTEEFAPTPGANPAANLHRRQHAIALPVNLAGKNPGRTSVQTTQLLPASRLCAFQNRCHATRGSPQAPSSR